MTRIRMAGACTQLWNQWEWEVHLPSPPPLSSVTALCHSSFIVGPSSPPAPVIPTPAGFWHLVPGLLT